MPKKGGKGQSTTTAGAADSQQPGSTVEDVKVEDSSSNNQLAGKLASSKQADLVPEEQKVDPELIRSGEDTETGLTVSDIKGGAPKMVRKNSRFDLTKSAEGKTREQGDVLYRPEFGEPKQEDKMWELMSSYIGSDQRSIQRSIVNHVEYTLARTRFNFDNKGAYQAAAYSVRDRLIEAWNDTQQYHTVSQRKETPDIQ